MNEFLARFPGVELDHDKCIYWDGQPCLMYRGRCIRWFVTTYTHSGAMGLRQQTEEELKDTLIEAAARIKNIDKEEELKDQKLRDILAEEKQ